jgi:hypothetical protein
MAQNFVPLSTPSSPGTRLGSPDTWRIKVLASSAVDSTGNPLAKAVELPPVAMAPAAFAAVNQGNISPQPKITCQREGDRITHIRIQCACGQVIELACEY